MEISGQTLGNCLGTGREGLRWGVVISGGSEVYIVRIPVDQVHEDCSITELTEDRFDANKVHSRINVKINLYRY